MQTTTRNAHGGQSCFTAEYTRENRSGGHIEFLSGIPTEGGLILTSSLDPTPDVYRIAKSGRAVRDITLAQVAVMERREVMFITGAQPSNCPEPEVIAMLRYCGGYAMRNTLADSLPGWTPLLLLAFALEGVESDTAVEFVKALPWDCNIDMRRAVWRGLHEAESLSRQASVKPNFRAQFEGRKPSPRSGMWK